MCQSCTVIVCFPSVAILVQDSIILAVNSCLFVAFGAQRRVVFEVQSEQLRSSKVWCLKPTDGFTSRGSSLHTGCEVFAVSWHYRSIRWGFNIYWLAHKQCPVFIGKQCQYFIDTVLGNSYARSWQLLAVHGSSWRLSVYIELCLHLAQLNLMPSSCAA